MDYSNKIARYEEIERRGLLDRLPPEKQEAWAEYKRRQQPKLNLSDEQKAQIEANNKAYEEKYAEPFIESDIVRKPAALVQGISNASLNPFGYLARSAGIDTKPLEAKDAVERALEKGGEYGYDAAALATIGNIAKGAGYLGKGNTVTSKVAQEVLAPEVLMATGAGVGGGLVEGVTNPSTAFGSAVANIIGASVPASVGGALEKQIYNVKGGLENILSNNKGVQAVSRGIATDEAIANRVKEEAPVAMNNLNERMRNALNRLTGRKLDIDQANVNQQNRMKEFVNKNANKELYSSKNAKQQAEENFDKWFEGSQIVDESGNPIPYYHGSLRKFNEFKQHNRDYNFSPDKEFAYNYAETKGLEQGIDNEPQLYSVFLKSKRPFDINNVDDLNNLSNYIKGKKIRVFGNEKSFDDFIEQAQGKYYDTPLRKGEFEKLDDPFFNKWYSHSNEKLDYMPSSVTEHKILDINKPEEYFIAGQPQWGLNIDDVEEQVKNQLKDVKWLNNKARVNVDVDTPYGKRVNYVDLIKVHKPSPKNLKEGADNWITLESADFDGEDFQDVIKKMGYDGYYKTEKGVKNLSVFNPNQIKSIENSGAWSKSASLLDAGWMPKASVDSYTYDFNQFQKDALKQALDKGAYMSTNAKGTLGATHRAQEVLNDMIEASYDTSIIGQKKPTTETRQLMQVKERLNQILEPSGIKPYDAGLSKAKALQDAYEKGYKFKPSETKFEALGLDKARDKRAFLQGRIASILDNVKEDKNIAKAIQADENTLRKLMQEGKYKQLLKDANQIDTEYERVKSLANQAESKLVRKVAKGRPMSEITETQGSVKGTILDKVLSAITRRGDIRRANQYLNPETTQIVTREGLKGAAKKGSAAIARQILIDRLNEE